MDNNNVVVIGTLDTKGPEIAYLRDKLAEFGMNPIVVDSGILGEPNGIVPDISRNEAAQYGGYTIDELRNMGSRGLAVGAMREALKTLTIDLYTDGRLQGITSMGGAEGAVMGAAAMMQLPVGVPKILVSPIASGLHYFDPLVGTSDIFVVHSIIDILGLNPIATTVFDNVAAAMSGLIRHGHELTPPGENAKYVAVTMLGNTTKAVMALKDRLAQDGYEAVIFHSNGVGGPAMEELAEAGQFVAVIDYTTNETYDPMTGGIHNGGPNRLRRVGKLGLPQVIVPGCIDFSVFHTGSVPDKLAGRPVYDHNPEYVLVRASHEEKIKLGHLFADRLNESVGPVEVVMPMRGLSIPATPDGPFWDPEGDEKFLKTLQSEIRSDFPIHVVEERHVNDPAFGIEVAEIFLSLMES